MTDLDATSDGADVPTLQTLIRSRIDERGLSFPALVQASGGLISESRWRQLAGGKRMNSWPEPKTLSVIAQTLGYDETTVVLAAAQTLGMNIRARGSRLAQLLPSGTDELTPRMQDAFLAMVRAAVADALDRDPETAHVDEDNPDGPLVGISRRDAPSSGRNAVRRTADTDL